MPKLIENYREEDIFNADETGLFYRCLPDKTLAFKGEKCHGGKHSKERITLLLAANMNGSEKIKPLLIGKSAKPRCFRGINWLPVDYKSNSKAWMTSALFEEWFIKLDRRFKAEKRKVLMFIDNCPSHPPDLKNKLTSIELKFFPPNMTSKLQPLDQGIIKNLKTHYRRRILTKIINVMERNKQMPKLNLLDCVTEISKAWDLDVKQQTITNCFKKAGFGQTSLWDEEDNQPLIFFRDRANTSSENTTEDDASLESEFQRWLTLCGLSSSLEDYENFINVDDDICTWNFPNDEDIINNYQLPQEQNSDSETDETLEPILTQNLPTKAIAQTALETLRL